MNQQITIKETNSTSEGWEFMVKISNNASTTNHKVTMNKNFYEDLETNENPEEVIHKSFEFLLERESKEMILSEFNVSVISNYFSDYKNKLKLTLKKNK